MKVQHQLDVPNTFALTSKATFGCIARSVSDVQAALIAAKKSGLEFVAIGSGSNIIPAGQVARFVCVMALRGVKLVVEKDDRVLIQASAGVNWHSFVMQMLSEGHGGLENLALIPGTVGASPVQNIGAYGVEVGHLIEAVGVLDESGTYISMTDQECEFSYRSSVFQRNRNVTIVDVTFRLLKNASPVWDYPQLQDYVSQHHHTNAPSAAQIADAVIAIRSAKLPDPSKYPNAGSFFKNPVITAEQVERLQEQHPTLSHFNVPEGKKLSAAQLIDSAGWKSRPSKHVACWDKQPLVLVNTGGATTADLLDYAEQIRRDIAERYEIQLEVEPSLLS